MYQTSIRNKKKHSHFQQNKDEYTIDVNNEEYAYVIKMLGNCRVSLISNIGEKSIGIIRGSLRKFNKRILIEKGDLVVISKRDYQTGKVDIVHKFNSEQSNQLIKDNKVSSVLINLYTHKTSIEDDKSSVINKNDVSEYFNFDNLSDSSHDEDIKDVNQKFKTFNLNNKGYFPRDGDNYELSDDDSDNENTILNTLTSNILIDKNNIDDDSSDASIDFI